MADVARRARVQHRRDAEEFLAIGRPLEALQDARAAATISEQLIAASTGGVVDFVLDCILIMDARAWMHQSEGIKEEALRASFLLQGAARRVGSFTASALETFGYATTSLLRHLIEHDMYSQVAALVETSAAVFDRLGPAHHLSRTLIALTKQHAKEDASNAVTRSHRAPVSDPSHHDLPSSPTFGPPRPPAADTSSDDSADDAEVRVHAQARRAADMRDKGDALYDAGLSFRMSGNISSAIKSLVAARAAFEVARNGFVSFGNTVEAGEITQQIADLALSLAVAYSGVHEHERAALCAHECYQLRQSFCSPTDSQLDEARVLLKSCTANLAASVPHDEPDDSVIGYSSTEDEGSGSMLPPPPRALAPVLQMSSPLSTQCEPASASLPRLDSSNCLSARPQNAHPSPPHTLPPHTPTIASQPPALGELEGKLGATAAQPLSHAAVLRPVSLDVTTGQGGVPSAGGVLPVAAAVNDPSLASQLPAKDRGVALPVPELPAAGILSSVGGARQQVSANHTSTSAMTSSMNIQSVDHSNVSGSASAATDPTQASMQQDNQTSIAASHVQVVLSQAAAARPSMVEKPTFAERMDEFRHHSAAWDAALERHKSTCRAADAFLRHIQAPGFAQHQLDRARKDIMIPVAAAGTSRESPSQDNGAGTGIVTGSGIQHGASSEVGARTSEQHDTPAINVGLSMQATVVRPLVEHNLTASSHTVAPVGAGAEGHALRPVSGSTEQVSSTRSTAPPSSTGAAPHKSATLIGAQLDAAPDSLNPSSAYSGSISTFVPEATAGADVSARSLSSFHEEGSVGAVLQAVHSNVESIGTTAGGVPGVSASLSEVAHVGRPEAYQPTALQTRSGSDAQETTIVSSESVGRVVVGAQQGIASTGSGDGSGTQAVTSTGNGSGFSPAGERTGLSSMQKLPIFIPAQSIGDGNSIALSPHTTTSSTEGAEVESHAASVTSFFRQGGRNMSPPRAESGLRTRSVVMTGVEIWSQSLVPLFTMGMLLRLGRQERSRRHSVKLEVVGWLIHQHKLHRNAALAVRLFSVGLMRMLASQRNIRRCGMKTFAIGFSMTALRRRRHFKMAAITGVVGMLLSCVRLRRDAERLRVLAEERARVEREGPKTKNLFWDTLRDVKGTIFEAQRGPGGGGVNTPSPTIPLDSLFDDVYEAFAAKAKAAPRPLAAAASPLVSAQAGVRGGSMGLEDSAVGASGSGTPSDSPSGVGGFTERIPLNLGKVQQNVDIALSKLGKPPYDRIALAIANGDIDGVGGSDVVAMMLGLPAELWASSTTEPVLKWAASVRAAATASGEGPLAPFSWHKHKLSPAERFIIEVVGTVPNLRAKLSVMQFVGLFREMHEAMQSGVASLVAACSELRESAKLQVFLAQVVLPLGNKLNEGTKKAGAEGIRLKSLSQLVSTKGATGSTVLEYIASKLHSQDSDLQSLSKEFPHLKEAKKAPPLLVIAGEVTKLRSILTATQAQAKAAAHDISASPGSKQQQQLLNKERASGANEHAPAAVTMHSPRDNSLQTGGAFLSRMGPHLSAAAASMAALEANQVEAESAYAATCRYFGEDGSVMPSDEFFGTLYDFVNAFTVAVAKAHADAERKARTGSRKSLSMGGNTSISPAASTTPPLSPPATESSGTDTHIPTPPRGHLHGHAKEAPHAAEMRTELTAALRSRASLSVGDTPLTSATISLAQTPPTAARGSIGAVPQAGTRALRLPAPPPMPHTAPSASGSVTGSSATGVGASSAAPSASGTGVTRVVAASAVTAALPPHAGTGSSTVPVLATAGVATAGHSATSSDSSLPRPSLDAVMGVCEEEDSDSQSESEVEESAVGVHRPLQPAIARGSGGVGVGSGAGTGSGSGGVGRSSGPPPRRNSAWERMSRASMQLDAIAAAARMAVMDDDEGEAADY